MALRRGAAVRRPPFERRKSSEMNSIPPNGKFPKKKVAKKIHSRCPFDAFDDDR